MAVSSNTPNPSNPSSPSDMSNEDMIALSLIALAPALLGQATGGETGGLGGAALGANAAGSVFQHKAKEESEAKKLAKALEAKEADRERDLQDKRDLIDYRAEKEAKKPKDPETRSVNGKLVQKNPETGEWEPVYSGADRLQQTQFVDKQGNPLVFNPKTGKYEVADIASNGASKRLSPTSTTTVKGGQDAINLLNNLEKSISGKDKLFGPVSGRAGGVNPYATESQVMQSELKTTAQIIGKYMEGGVLRKEDEAKYERMLPQLKDTPEVAKKKLDLVRKMLREKYQSEVQALKEQGYDVRGLELKGQQEGWHPPMAPEKPLDEMTDEELDAELSRLKGES